MGGGRDRAHQAAFGLVAFGLVAAVAFAGRAEAKPCDHLDRMPAVAAARTVDLIATRFDVTLDFDARFVSGTSTLTVAGLANPSRIVAVDAVAMEINAVRDAATGATLGFDYDGRVIAIPLDPPLLEGQERSLAIDYRATPTAGLVFVRPSPRRPAGHREAWTQGEEEDTHYWLPSIDRLDDFGTTEAIVTVPRGLSVLANGRLVAQEEVGAATRWRWRQDQPHATYLTFIAAGPYEVAHHTWRQLPVAFWYLPWQRRQAPGSLAPTFAALDCFADTLGRTYPWEKYDQIAVSDYPFGGMENTTATPWR